MPSTRPTRRRVLPARFQNGASQGEVSGSFGDTIQDDPLAEKPTLCYTEKNTSPSPLPSQTSQNTQQGPRKRRRIKRESQVTAIIPSDEQDVAVVTGETINGVLDTALATVATTTIKASTEVKPDGEPIRETKRRVKLKTDKQLHQEEKAREKGRLGGLSEVEFTRNLDNTSTVEFAPFAEGPPREPQPVYPPDIDCDSPSALFSLFWDEKICQILATNTN